MLITEILEEKEGFTEIEKVIADYFLESEEELQNKSARQIAKAVYTAPSSITRLCQKLGFSGYDDFKTSYVKELTYLSSHFHKINPNNPFDYQDKNMVITNKIAQLYYEYVKDVVSLVTHDLLQKTINILAEADTIYICSSGVQAELANAFKNKMIKIGKKVFIESKMDEAFFRASFCSQRDTFIILSYTGETESMLRVARKVKERTIPLIAITSYGENSLSRLASTVLYASTRETLIDNLGDFGMNLSTIFLLDALYAAIFNIDYHKNFQNRIKATKGFEIERSSTNTILTGKNE